MAARCPVRLSRQNLDARDRSRVRNISAKAQKHEFEVLRTEVRYMHRTRLRQEKGRRSGSLGFCWKICLGIPPASKPKRA